jgi:hypothetical protein
VTEREPQLGEAVKAYRRVMYLQAEGFSEDQAHEIAGREALADEQPDS